MSWIHETPVIKIDIDGSKGSIILKKRSIDDQDIILIFENDLFEHESFLDQSRVAMLFIFRSLEEIDWGDNPDILIKETSLQ